MVTIGIVAFQGGFYEHYTMLLRAFAETSIEGEVKLVKKKKDLEGLDGIIIPGGESTTIGKIAHKTGILYDIKEAIEGGKPTLATCAGAIMLAKKVRDAKVPEFSQPLLGVMDIGVVRNYFGRQRESFELDLHIEGMGEAPYRGIFIRAPAIVEVWGGARTISKITYNEAEVTVFASQGSILATTFHPELTRDTRIHKRFISLVKR